MTTTNAKVTCPLCHKQHADAVGHTDGPREYHADCWEALNQIIERATNSHTSTDSITIDLRGRLDRTRAQDVIDILGSLAIDDLDYVLQSCDGYVDLDAWDSEQRWHVYLD